MTDWEQRLNDTEPLASFGRVIRAGSEVIESAGPSAPLGATCRLGVRSGEVLLADVVGFRDGRLLRQGNFVVCLELVECELGAPLPAPRHIVIGAAAGGRYEPMARDQLPSAPPLPVVRRHRPEKMRGI